MLIKKLAIRLKINKSHLNIKLLVEKGTNEKSYKIYIKKYHLKIRLSFLLKYKMCNLYKFLRFIK